MPSSTDLESREGCVLSMISKISSMPHPIDREHAEPTGENFRLGTSCSSIILRLSACLSGFSRAHTHTLSNDHRAVSLSELKLICCRANEALQTQTSSADRTERPRESPAGALTE
jgi:hypothetical protein